MKILIVDDEPVNIGVLANALKGSYEICTAQSGDEAIRLVKEAAPDLVLLDVMMPELDGFEVCRIIRAEPAYADLPIIFVTAMESREGEAQGLELGAVDYITKPVNLRLAKLRVRNQIELRRQTKLVKEQNALLIQQQEALKASEERFRTIADYTYDWEYWAGVGGEMLYVSPACERVSGYTQAEFYADPGLLERIVHPEDATAYAAHHEDNADQGESSITFRILTKSGGVLWIAHGCRAVVAEDGRPLGRRANNRDITELKNAEQLARQLSLFDPLTGLPNRRMLLDRLHSGLSQAKRFGRALAVLYLDLDHFKLINDSFGHETGDGLLIEVAKRLTACVRSGDTVSRSGGDEFIIVLQEIENPADAALVAKKILQALGEPVRVDGRTLEVTTSIGVAVYPVNGTDDAVELMRKSDSAMYVAKQSGRNAYRLFSEETASIDGPGDEPRNMR